MVRSNRIKRSIVQTLLLCLTFAAAFGQEKEKERIIRFHADIVIDTDGRIEVAEHITVYAAGQEIKRGIVRELPLYRKNKKGKRVSTEYKVLSVMRDGIDSPYHIGKESDKLEIYTGEADVFLQEGEYEYVIVYESYGHVGFFDEYDDLYWNVTGNDWIFAIERASATVSLPDSAQVIQMSCYTGKKGSTEKLCSCNISNDGLPIFTANGTLAPHEGLTIAVGFTRDIIDRTKDLERQAKEAEKAAMWL